MKKKHSIILILGVAIIVLGSLSLWLVLSRSSSGASPASGTSADAPPLITTAKPSRRTFTLQVPWIGKVEPVAKIELTALVTGRVVEIVAGDQQTVEKDQPIMRLGGPQIDERRSMLSAETDALGTQVQLAGETLGRLEKNLAAQLASKDQVAAAKEEKTRLEAQLREARLRLDTLDHQRTITAPIEGVFTGREVSTGQDVAAGDVVGRIIDTSHLRIKASVFPQEGVELPGRKSVVRTGGRDTVSGTVTKILPEASSTGATEVWIESPEIDALLRPGQTVEGLLAAGSDSEALAVPESAIVYDKDDRPCLFVRSGESYERLDVRTGMDQDGWVEIVSGLMPDQLVVVNGAYELLYQDFDQQFKVQD